MALTIKTLDARELPTTSATIYTVPGSTKTRDSELWISNNTALTRTFSLWIVNSGGSEGDDNKLVNAMDIPQNVPLIFSLNTYLDTGDFVRIIASGADCALRLSGIEEA